MEWLNKKEEFTEIDVRNLTTNFLPGILKKAENIKIGKGLCILQSFEPKPLYGALSKLGFENYTEKNSENEYKVYFYRTKDFNDKKADMPFKPTAILNFKNIDPDLAANAVNFWDMTWNKENPAIPLETKLLLSLSNALGARRFRQATRELIKAYSLGVEIEVFDELLSLCAWNQGFGFFASEVGPSVLFQVYKFIKKQESSPKCRKEIVKEVMEKFGEEHPGIGTVPKL